MSAQDFVECFALGAAEGLLAKHVEDRAQRGATALFNFTIKFDKWDVEPLGQQLAQGGFAAAAQTNECNAFAARIFRRCTEFLQQHSPRFCECRWRQALEELRQQDHIERGLGPFLNKLRDRQADGPRRFAATG